ncbi:MAG TPA: DedA family protein [Burkholderiales bacterium]|nr:DedA family protein [Burkholderiales bacterium]
MLELVGLLGASFAAATLFPLPSEAALFAYLQAHPGDRALAVVVATLGNTAGGMTSYLIGRAVPQRKRLNPKVLASVSRFGAPLTLLAWLPLIGDAICVAAGWLRIRWWAALGFMAAGRLARYILVAWLST